MTNGIYSGYEKFEFVLVVGKEVVKSGLANNHNKKYWNCHVNLIYFEFEDI